MLEKGFGLVRDDRTRSEQLLQSVRAGLGSSCFCRGRLSGLGWIAVSCSLVAVWGRGM